MEQEKQSKACFLYTTLIALTSLLSTFLLSRIIYMLTVHGHIPPFQAFFPLGDMAYHIHHYVFGVFALSILGYLALFVRNATAVYITSALYGITLGLIYDETNMWLFLTQKNSELIATIAVGSIMLLFILGIFTHLLSKKKE